jgi:hypothetical protein
VFDKCFNETFYQSLKKSKNITLDKLPLSFLSRFYNSYLPKYCNTLLDPSLDKSVKEQFFEIRKKRNAFINNRFKSCLPFTLTNKNTRDSYLDSFVFLKNSNYFTKANALIKNYEYLYKSFHYETFTRSVYNFFQNIQKALKKHCLINITSLFPFNVSFIIVFIQNKYNPKFPRNYIKFTDIYARAGIHKLDLTNIDKMTCIAVFDKFKCDMSGRKKAYYFQNICLTQTYLLLLQTLRIFIYSKISNREGVKKNLNKNINIFLLSVIKTKTKIEIPKYCKELVIMMLRDSFQSDEIKKIYCYKKLELTKYITAFKILGLPIEAIRYVLEEQ